MIGYGSVQGFTHKKMEYNNQDFVLVIENDTYKIGLVADGCGSVANSEVGAQLGLKFLAKRIINEINSDWKTNLKADLQKYSKTLANSHSDDTAAFVQDFLLYTIVGFVLKDDLLTLFSFGDGVIIIDDKIEIINQNNKPKYINNELIGGEGGQFEFREIEFTNQKIIIGSDGLEDLLNGIENNLISEFKTAKEFINEENNFKNLIQLPKLLSKYSNKGILKDDCTLIMMKR